MTETHRVTDCAQQDEINRQEWEEIYKTLPSEVVQALMVHIAQLAQDTGSDVLTTGMRLPQATRYAAVDPQGEMLRQTFDMFPNGEKYRQTAREMAQVIGSQDDPNKVSQLIREATLRLNNAVKQTI